MKSIANQLKEGKPVDLREQGLRILARIIAQAYLDTNRNEKDKKETSPK